MFIKINLYVYERDFWGTKKSIMNGLGFLFKRLNFVNFPNGNERTIFLGIKWAIKLHLKIMAIGPLTSVTVKFLVKHSDRFHKFNAGQILNFLVPYAYNFALQNYKFKLLAGENSTGTHPLKNSTIQYLQLNNFLFKILIFTLNLIFKN